MRLVSVGGLLLAVTARTVSDTTVEPLARRAYWGVSRGLVELHATVGDDEDLLRSHDAVLAFHGVGEDPHAGFTGNVTREHFERVVAFVTDHFSVVPLSAVGDEDAGGRVAITFDDGLRSVTENALPVLEANDAPATVFVNPGFVDDANRELFLARHGIAPDGTGSDGTTPGERVMLTSADLRELAASPLITIGNHTMTHPDLTAVEDPAVLRREIAGARDHLADHYGIDATVFCYPYGRIDDRSRRLVEESHDRSVTTEPTLVGAGQGPHDLPRVGGSLSLDELRWELTEASDAMYRIRRSWIDGSPEPTRTD